MNAIKILLAIILVNQASLRISFAEALNPDSNPLKASALKATKGIVLDGFLNETDWAFCKPLKNFTQQWPTQGEMAQLDTEVRILYDDKNLYFGMICYDSLKNNTVRVTNFRRDFTSGSDYVNISIDAFGDKSTAYVFYTTPLGVHGDAIVLDDTYFDMDWNAIWHVKTSINDTCWVAEFAIPWTTLRYPRTDGEAIFNINFGRGVQRINETSTWSPVPRAYGMNNMRYSGKLSFQSIPEPSTNIQFQPYLLSQTNQNFDGGIPVVSPKAKLDFGGELKWAITPQTVVDVTYNTDFAQADVDDQVVNYERYSYYFPEKRQFFLENSSAFTATFNTHFPNQPFYSRRIGLDDSGNPIPILGGARLVSRNTQYMLGALIIRQQEQFGSPSTNFGVLRYTHNFSANSKLGGIITFKNEERLDSIYPTQNYTATVDGFSQITKTLSWSYLASGSITDGKFGGDGLALSSFFLLRSSLMQAWLTQTLITNSYNPEVGFVNRKDILYHASGIRSRWQPHWKPDAVRYFGPGISFEHYNSATSGTCVEGIYTITPIVIVLQNGHSFSWNIDYQHQNLIEPFFPLGVKVNADKYNYLQSLVSLATNPSNKFSGTIAYRCGGFYDGNIARYRAILAYSPIPNISFSTDYFITNVKNLGEHKTNINVTTAAASLRLALNPKVQLITGFQWNSLSDFTNWNLRFAWEFRPLSFIYIVLNSNEWNNPESPMLKQNAIGKVSYIMQI